MRRLIGMRRAAAGLLALWMACGAGLPATAENWPEETVQDAEGNTYKQESTEDGGIRIWRFVGIFGSTEEALVSVGLSEVENSKAKKTSDGVVEGKKKKTKSRKDTKKRQLPLKYKGTLKPREAGGAVVSEKKERTMKRKSRSNRLVRIRNVPVMTEKDVWKGYNQIYVQDNRGSGR